MQNFEIKNNYLLIKNKNQIKNLWLENFSDDSENVVNKFLENVFKNKKGVGTFFNNELIAMILFFNSKIIYKNQNKNAVYFYAVCTGEKYRNQGIMKSLFEYAKEWAKEQGLEICFLVPENEELFKMYEKFSFKRTIGYSEKLVNRDNIGDKNTIHTTKDFCYEDYERHRLKLSENHPVIIWEEDEFNFIFDKTRNDVSFIFSNSGYAIYEKLNNEILVSEICGNEVEIANSIFNREAEYEKIILRLPDVNCKTDFGMTFNSDNGSDDINSIYFGMPYR